MNQKSRQMTSTSVERDFFKLLNNNNFGTDCHNNIDNCTHEPLNDDIGGISYINKFTTIFNGATLRDFFARCHHFLYHERRNYTDILRTNTFP